VEAIRLRIFPVLVVPWHILHGERGEQEANHGDSHVFAFDGPRERGRRVDVMIVGACNITSIEKR
jgi:hypothetical protein